MNKVFWIWLLSLCYLLTNCTNSSPSYSANSVGQVSQVEQGQIIDILQVNIKGSDNIGARVGGLAGG
ncbi:hypothetical protein NAI59_09485, partial [Francisella tularensis subsp. holarctica]|nr:hypothetical protein [Francisella tularensis subsp. holarctica]